MSIVQLRVDNRLVHGQVTVGWVNLLNANRIVVADDDAAGDEFERDFLRMSARDVDTSVFTVSDAVTDLVRDRAEVNTLVIVRSIENCAALLEGGVRVDQINIGNQAPIPGTKYKMVTRTIAVTEEQVPLYERIFRDYKEIVVCKMLPSDKPRDLAIAIQKKFR